MAKVPNFLIVGAEKCGTTWLHSVLKQHPEIYLPATKEVNFFNSVTSDGVRLDRYEKQGIEWYREFFKKAESETAVGEASPMYLCDPVAADRIKQTLGGPRIVIVIRNPIDRFESHLNMEVGRGLIKHVSSEFYLNGFLESSFFHRSFYFEDIKRFIDKFGARNVLVIRFDDLKNFPQNTLEHICGFLEIDASFPFKLGEGEKNAQSGFKSVVIGRSILWLTRVLRSVRFGGIFVDFIKKIGVSGFIKNINSSEYKDFRFSESERRRLYEFFKSDINKVESLVGLDLRDWY